METNARHTAHEIRGQSLDQRLDALSQALSAECHARMEALQWMEAQIHEVRGASPQAFSYVCSANPSVMAPAAVLSNGLHAPAGGAVARATSSTAGEEERSRSVTPTRAPARFTPALGVSPPGIRSMMVSDSSSAMATVSPPRVITYVSSPPVPRVEGPHVSASPRLSPTTTQRAEMPVGHVMSPQPPFNQAHHVPAEMAAGYVMPPLRPFGEEWVPAATLIATPATTATAPIEAPATEMAWVTTTAPFVAPATEAATATMTAPMAAQAATDAVPAVRKVLAAKEMETF